MDERFSLRHGCTKFEYVDRFSTTAVFLDSASGNHLSASTDFKTQSTSSVTRTLFLPHHLQKVVHHNTFPLSFVNSAIHFRATMLRAVAKLFQFFMISLKKHQQ
jgi:hypothetical protein